MTASARSVRGRAARRALASRRVGAVLPALAPALLLALLLALPAAGLQEAGGGQAAGGNQAEGGATAEPEQEQSAQDSDTIDQGRSVAAQVAAGESDALFARMTTEMRGAFGGVDGLKTFLAQVADQLGAERAVLSETEERAPGVHVYVRTSRHEKLEIPIVLQVAFNSKGAVAGMFVRPVQTEAQSEHLERETVAALSLPFEGEWDVFWGGRSVAQNYHAAHADQRFAYDILALVDGTSHTGEGQRNEDYHCWDRAILSPGAGKVVAAVDGVEDNAPGVMNPRQPVGNHVIIDHGNGEFSFLAHFRKGTLAVDVGQDVTAATLLGRCGNSGNSSEPHLHYHLQDTAVFGKGVGLPSQFLDYVADGEPVARGEPVRGQSIRRAP